MRAAAAGIVALACFLYVVRSGHAEGNIHLGQLRIHPFVQVSRTSSDNIFNTAENETKDTIVTCTPGLKLERVFGKHRAEAQYYSVLKRYDTYKDENTTDRNANGQVDLKLGSFFGFRLSDVYARGHEDRGDSSTGFIEKFKNNTGMVSATYQLADRSKIQFDISRISWEFETSKFRDRDESLFSGYLYYRFLPKTSAFIEIDRRNVDFSDPASLELNNIVMSGFMGLRWEMTEKSNGTIKGGALSKDFMSPANEDYEGWTGAIDLRHAFSDYTNILLKGERVVYEATIEGASYVVSTGAYAEFNRRFLRRLGMSMRGSYGISQFSNPRRDRTSAGGGSLKYFFRDWLEFSIDYSSRVRHSNQPENNFKEHLTMFSATFAL